MRTRESKQVIISEQLSKAEAIRALRGRKQTGMTTDEFMKLLRDTDPRKLSTHSIYSHTG